MRLGPGLTISPNVRLARMLGEGGMGSVWVADHLTLGTQVAVKFVSAGLAGDRGVLARFSREATSAARIKSPHVVQVFDHGVFDDLPYIVMELLEGEDLEHRLARVRVLGPGETAQIIQQACKALTVAHALGIIHRDIKPANLFLTSSAGETFVKLLDFGIAKLTTVTDPANKTATGALVGTPAYMSFEQVFAQGQLDFRTDLWSLAVVAYECLTGELPFGGDTPGSLFVSLHEGAYRAPSSFANVPWPALDGWFARAFSRNPDQRFGSAKELSDTFGAVLAACTRDRAAVADTRLAPSFASQPEGRPVAFAVSGHTFGSSMEKRPSPPVSASRGTRVVVVVGAALAAAVLGAVGFSLRATGGRQTSTGIDASPEVPPPSAASGPSVAPTPAAPVESATGEPSATAVAEAPPRSATVTPAQSATVAPAKSASAAPTKSTPRSPRRRDHGF